MRNPFDPEAPVQDRNWRSASATSRARLEACYGAAAKMLIEATESSYQVTLTFPAKTIYEDPARAWKNDEELARQILREYLAGEADIEIIGECPNGFEAVKAVKTNFGRIWLFLDVQMPKLDGFEVLELIDSSVAVVFVTAYDQYAMRAFDAAAVDYLLKPFTSERFRASLDRVRARFASAAAPPAHPRDLKLASRAPGEFLERLVVKDGPRVHVVAASKLDYTPGGAGRLRRSAQ